MYRVPEFAIQGDTLAFMQHAHLARRVLEIGKWLALGHAAPAPATLAPRGGNRAVPRVSGGYVPVTAGGTTYQIYYETAGSGRDVLCMHTAGADGRQFHGLMADARITEGHRLVAFDLPWHGKSPPPEGAIPGSWCLNTELYVALIMGFIAAAGLEKPVALGASMSGEICLELAYRHPEAFAGIVACEACEQVDAPPDHLGVPPPGQPGAVRAGMDPWPVGTAKPGGVAGADHLAIRPGRAGGVLRRYRVLLGRLGRARKGRPHRHQPLPAVHADRRIRLLLHSGDVGGDGGENPRCAVPAMQGIGHFPFAENPALFADYLLPILADLATSPSR